MSLFRRSKEEKEKRLKEKERKKQERIENNKNFVYFLFNFKEVFNYYYHTIGIKFVVLILSLVLGFVLTIYFNKTIIGIIFIALSLIIAFFFLPELNSKENNNALFKKKEEWFEKRENNK